MAMTSHGGRAVDDVTIGGGDEERRHCRYKGQRRVRSPAAGTTATDASMQPSAPTNDGDGYTTRAADDSASPRMVIPPCCRHKLALVIIIVKLIILLICLHYIFFRRRLASTNPSVQNSKLENNTLMNTSELTCANFKFGK